MLYMVTTNFLSYEGVAPGFGIFDSKEKAKEAIRKYLLEWPTHYDIDEDTSVEFAWWSGAYECNVYNSITASNDTFYIEECELNKCLL